MALVPRTGNPYADTVLAYGGARATRSIVDYLVDNAPSAVNWIARRAAKNTRQHLANVKHWLNSRVANSVTSRRAWNTDNNYHSRNPPTQYQMARRFRKTSRHGGGVFSRHVRRIQRLRARSRRPTRWSGPQTARRGFRVVRPFTWIGAGRVYRRRLGPYTHPRANANLNWTILQRNLRRVNFRVLANKYRRRFYG